MNKDNARKRLTDAMEARKEDLGLTWREVANDGGTTIETLRAVRRGTNEILPRTRKAIEAGLRWPRGYVTDILDGKKPSGPERPKSALDDIRQMAESLQTQARELIERLDNLGQEGENPQVQ